jgi:hypothetical protein
LDTRDVVDLGTPRTDSVQRTRRCDGTRRRLGRDRIVLSLVLLTLGNVRRELTLELGSPARSAAATSIVRSIRPAMSPPIPALGASKSWLAVADICPAMDGGDEHENAHRDHRSAQEYRPTRGPQRV